MQKITRSGLHTSLFILDFVVSLFVYHARVPGCSSQVVDCTPAARFLTYTVTKISERVSRGLVEKYSIVYF